MLEVLLVTWVFAGLPIFAWVSIEAIENAENDQKYGVHMTLLSLLWIFNAFIIGAAKRGMIG